MASDLTHDITLRVKYDTLLQPIPIGSMYGVWFTNIYFKNQPNAYVNIPYVDGTGYSVVFSGDSSNHLGLAKSGSYTPSAGSHPESFHRVVHNHL